MENAPKNAIARRLRRPLYMLLGLIGALWGSVVAAPQLLAFPYRADIGSTTVYSETPIHTDDMRRVLARSDALLQRTGFAEPAGTRLFLTRGGWRWTVLALNSRGAFAVTRPASAIVSDAVLVNRADPATDVVFNRPTADSRRRHLSGVIAHERTHIQMNRAIGYIRAATLPQWQREGYADYIAEESGLTPQEYARLKRSGEYSPAIVYYEGRKRIEALAAKKGGTIAALFGTGGE